MESFTDQVIQLILQIPYGTVVSYGKLAELAGNKRAARQVSYILHSSSQKYNLPWHRVVGKGGQVRIHDLLGQQMQIDLLKSEGIEFDGTTILNFSSFEWLGVHS